MYWLGRYLDPVTLTYILSSSAFYTFYVDVLYLLNNKAYNHQTLHSASPQCTDCRYLDSVTLTYISCSIDFYTFLHHPSIIMSSTIRPSTTKPCIVLLLDVLTRQVPWPSDLDLYFALQLLWQILRSYSISLQI